MSADLQAQLDRIEALLAAMRDAQAVAAKPILTTAEAMRVANCESESAFYRWARTWGATASGNGRWPRHRLVAALEKEGRSAKRARARADRRPDKLAA